jgi:hypothetical protein
MGAINNDVKLGINLASQMYRSCAYQHLPIMEPDLVEIKAKNSTMFTSKILGIHLNDLIMNQANNQNIEERLD